MEAVAEYKRKLNLSNGDGGDRRPAGGNRPPAGFLLLMTRHTYINMYVCIHIFIYIELYLADFLELIPDSPRLLLSHIHIRASALWAQRAREQRCWGLRWRLCFHRS